MRDGALTLYSEVVSTPVRWLWYPFIAAGKITLLQGDPGDGKSTMMMNLIATVTTGGMTEMKSGGVFIPDATNLQGRTGAGGK